MTIRFAGFDLWGDKSGPPGRWDSFFKFDVEMVTRLADQLRRTCMCRTRSSP